MALIVIVWVCQVIGYEIRTYTKVRHRRLLSVDRFKNAHCTTILVTDIPASFLKPEHLRVLYGVFPGGVRQVSTVRNLTGLRQKIEERRRIVFALEKAETYMIVKAQRLGIAGQSIPEFVSANREQLYPSVIHTLWRWPLRKIDTIHTCRARLKDLNAEIRNHQRDQSGYPEYPSALIRFHKPSGAFMASLSVLHTEPHSMAATLIEDSSHIIWENLTLGWWERWTRRWLLACLSTSVIMLCTVPVAFTGLLSQLSYTATLFSWLAWLETLPLWLLSTFQGVLPPVILAATMAAAPILLRRLVLAQGRISRIDSELAFQDYYFAFLFLQVFGVVSVSSSVATVLSSLKYDFVSLAALLALNLPKAANYFLSYILLQAFSVSAGALLQGGRLLRFATAPLGHDTARDTWVRSRRSQMEWGSFFPVYTNLATITLIYSVVTPLILVLSILAFTSFWIVQRYNLLRVTSSSIDTGGLVYVKGLFQLFVGLYCMEVYLIGLFLLVRNEKNEATCIGQAIVLIIVMGLTATYHVFLQKAYKPLIKSVPAILSTGTVGNVPVQQPDSQDPKDWTGAIRRYAAHIFQKIHRFVEEDISTLEDNEQAELSRSEITSDGYHFYFDVYFAVIAFSNHFLCL